MTKAEIRAKMAEAKKALSSQTREVLSAAVVKKIQTLDVFRSAQAVGAYMPLPDEVDLGPLFDPLSSEKTLCVPAFDDSSGIYRMAWLTTELRTGRFGIPEPVTPLFATEKEIDLILVPGVAFDRTGFRIGRGSGFYDRMLPKYRTVRVGICFDFQCLETVPAENYDIQMDCLVTESEVLKFSMNG